jgi:hypothetical protein
MIASAALLHKAAHPGRKIVDVLPNLSSNRAFSIAGTPCLAKGDRVTSQAHAPAAYDALARARRRR